VQAKADAGGVGFMFVKADKLVGIDLDGCCDPDTGEIIEAWAQEIVDAHPGGFLTPSPSGTGLHLIVRGELPMAGSGKKMSLPGTYEKCGEVHSQAIEAYHDRRYFTACEEFVPDDLSAELDLAVIERTVFEQTGKEINWGPRAAVEGGGRSTCGAHDIGGEDRRPRWYGPDETLPDGITAAELVQDGLNRSSQFERQYTNIWFKTFAPKEGTDASQSGWDLRLSRLLVSFGFSDCFIEDLLHEYRTKHSADTDDPDKCLRPDYLRATINAALEIIANPVKLAKVQLEEGALNQVAKKKLGARKRKKKSKQGSEKQKPKVEIPKDGRPEVLLFPSDMANSVDKAQEALVKLEATRGRNRKLYMQGGALVQLVSSEDGEKLSMPVKTGAIREHMGRAARFLTVSDDPEEDPKLVDFPRDYAVAYLDRGEAQFPLLRGISRVPLLLGTGELVTTHGYDAASQVYVDVTTEDWIGIVYEKPSLDHARAALAYLLDAVREFPFLAECDCSAAIAAILTTVGRYLIEAAPLFVVSAPSRGAGKSELVEFSAMIATGQKARGYQFRADPTEMDKLFHSIFLESVPCVHLENVEVELRGAPLCTALSQARYARRILGISATSAPATTGTTWFASGVNVTVASDVVRRVLRIELDPKMERPEERQFERNLSLWAQENRRNLVGAALTILAAYLRAGKPPQDYSPWAGFEGWNATVRAALLWLGLEDPCAVRQQLDEEDPEREDLAVVLGVLWEIYPGASFTSNEVADRWSQGDHPAECLRAVFTDVLDDMTARSLGNYLRTRKNRIVNGLRCIRVGHRSNRVLWMVEQVEGAS